MKRKLFIGVLVLFFNVLTYSQSYQSYEDFTYAATDVSDVEYYFIIEKVKDSSKEVWIKAVTPEKTVKNKKGKYIKTGGSYEMSLMNLYCEDRTYDVIQTIYYAKNGKVTNSDFDPNYGIRIIPGTVMSAIFNTVCGN